MRKQTLQPSKKTTQSRSGGCLSASDTEASLCLSCVYVDRTSGIFALDFSLLSIVCEIYPDQFSFGKQNKTQVLSREQFRFRVSVSLN